jgi:succinyl-diaminopimelate desuccinylase
MAKNKNIPDFKSDRLLGMETHLKELAENRANVTGRLKGTGEKPALLLNGHSDTVPPGDIEWKYSPYSGTLVDDKIFGRGSADMKGGLTAMLMAIKAIVKSGVTLKGDLVFSVSAGEETDSVGALKFVDDGGLNGVGAIIIGEPSSCGVNVAEKGALWIEITAYGKTAHGAFPDKGINAIVNMNALISELISYQFAFEKNDILGHPTMNISTIHGGVKTNVVPDKCSVTVDMRTVPGMSHSAIIKDFENIIAKLSGKTPDFKADIKILNDRAAVETKASHPFVQLAIGVIQKEFNKELKAEGVNFYTDASIFLPASGLPCIFYGPGEASMAHQPNEYTSVDNLMEATHFYCAMIEEY